MVGDVLAGDVSRLYLAPTGGFLVAARTGALHVFAIDAASGSLTEVDGAGESLAVASVGAAAFSPDGAYLFIGMRDNSLRPYRFDASTGSIMQANVEAIVEACR